MELNWKVQFTICFIIAFIVTKELTMTKLTIERNPIKTVTMSDNVKYTYLDITVNPGTATTFQRLVAAVNSPHVKIYENVSLDNKSWVEIPTLNFTFCNKTTDIQNFANITYINLNQLTTPKITIHIQYIIPRNQTLPQITGEMLGKTISTCMVFNNELTSNDWALRLLLFLTIWVSLLSLIDFIINNTSKKIKHYSD